MPVVDGSLDQRGGFRKLNLAGGGPARARWEGAGRAGAAAGPQAGVLVLQAAPGPEPAGGGGCPSRPADPADLSH